MSRPPALSQDLTLIKVPAVKGRPPEIAEQIVRLMGMKSQQGVFLIAAASWREDITPGVVQMQTPQPGTLLPEAGTVAFWTFAKAPEGTKVVNAPDVRKRSRKEATQRLRAAGLEPMRVEDESANEAALVEDQYPRPGQPVPAGTSVYLKSATR
jgi:beta-lactam-binding protein with PASTA domain